MWSAWGWVTRMWVISIPSRSARSSSGPRSSLPSIRTPVPPLRVGDQVGVRQPLRVLGPLDDHAAPPFGRVLELSQNSGGGRDGAALEQRAGDQLGVVPGRRVADAGQDEEAGAGGAALRLAAGRPGGRARPRRSSPARPPGSRLGSKTWVAHRPVGAVVAVGVDPAEDQLAAGGGRDPLRVGGEGGEHARRAGGAGRRAPRRPAGAGAGPDARGRAWRGPSGARQRPAGESAVTEAAQPSRPISSPTQAPRLLPATCGRSIPSSSQLACSAAARLAAVGSTPAGSGGAAPKPGMSSTITSRSASSSGSTGSQT